MQFNPIFKLFYLLYIFISIPEDQCVKSIDRWTQPEEDFESLYTLFSWKFVCEFLGEMRDLLPQLGKKNFHKEMAMEDSCEIKAFC